MMQRSLILITLSTFANFASCQSLIKGFEALEIHNYFKAKHVFEKNLKRNPSLAAFGLAEIYARNNNPFYNIDSALSTIQKAYETFESTKPKKQKKFAKFGFDLEHLNALRQNIFTLHFVKAKSINTESAYQEFIQLNTMAQEIERAVFLRDSCAFFSALNDEKSDALQSFLDKYPSSVFAERALNMFYQLQYEEQTDPNNQESFLAFKENFPNNPYGTSAEIKLFNFAKETNSIAAFLDFIKNNPNSTYTKEAWRHIYRLHINENGMANLQTFKKEHPGYPFQKELDKEIKLLQTQLFPFVQNNLWGFIDHDGRVVIEPKYAFADFFSQGRALVLKNEKYGFIDVLGNEIIVPQFNDAYTFKYNMCIVITNEKKTGLMDLFGNWLVQPKYDDIMIINPNKVWLQSQQGYQLFDVNKNIIHPTIFTEITEFHNNYCLVFDQDKQMIIDLNGNTSFATDNALERFGDFFILDAQDSLAVIDETGKVILPYHNYKFGNHNTKGLTPFVLNDKIGYINQDLEIIIAPKFDVFPNWKMFANFNNSFAKAYNAKSKKFGLINDAGQWSIQAKYNDISFFSDKIAVLHKKWEFIDKNEKKLNLGSFDLAESFINESALIYFGTRNVWNLLSKEGQTLLDTNILRINRLDENILRWQDATGNLWLGDANGTLLFSEACERIDKIEDNIVRLLSQDTVYYYLIKENRIIKLAEK